jgi:hypothetical protein
VFKNLVNQPREKVFKNPVQSCFARESPIPEGKVMSIKDLPLPQGVCLYCSIILLSKGY